ncbi:hypothetical protein VA596_18705 [Amycolatopsis sp., V23-08]|uniref:PH domain-containing protein n=1 Tax=Amycolatopsis heterodermiae TaxID=3110235 RepID=A0ABU5R8I3_9PSEU|nr:hypothetical protein [Amycolatopsis sp., V23-08]MEA5361581.1 hypothetical protein [Amycolatopsis sp., V23-08]
MDIASGADRVRAYEPLPRIPSGAETLFAGYVRQLTSTVILRMGLNGALVAFGVLVAVVERRGSALPYVYLVVFGTTLAVWSYVLRLYLRIRSLFGEPYHRLDVAPGGLLVKGSRVCARLPDGRWLRVRLSGGWRVQLAGERRLWVLGSGRRVFVRLPGAMAVRAARIEDTPLPGATPVEVVSRRPTPPRLDPVLAAQRAFLIRRMLVSGLTCLVLGAAGFAALATMPVGSSLIVGPAATGGVAGGSGVFVLLGVLMLAGLLRIRRPVTEDVWVELRVALDGTFVPRTRGVARLTGWALHPDGRQTRFRLFADVSLAANVTATGQLWSLGYPQPAKLNKAGLPGYPCAGTFRLT